MIQKLTLYISDSLDVYYNMAVEKYLTQNAAPDECVLYLWQNDRTVVIGRNQNCWAECHVSVLEADGGHLARRLSGGGAVYHDVGNLNFTFAASAQNYDIQKHCRVICEAVKKFGLCAEVSGRNDILIDGAKFSGNAFYKFGQNHYHHGTILIKTDTEEMQKYLSVDPEKLKAKGVASVRSRVVNLAELSDEINVDSMTAALKNAFGQVYGSDVLEMAMPSAEEVEVLCAEFKSDEWKYNRTPAFTHKLSDRFSWGGITLELDVQEGSVTECRVYSDALDSEYISTLADKIKGCRYDAVAIGGAVGCERQENRDITALFLREI